MRPSVPNPIVEVAGQKYSVDKKLMHNWDKIKDGKLAQLDEDRVYIVDGREGCQPKGSKVMMADGCWKNIEEVKKGDIVLSPQEDGSNIYSKVLVTHTFFSKKTFDVFELNRQKRKLYSCSEGHEIPINKRKTYRNKTKNKWVVENYLAEDLFKKSNRFVRNTTTPTMFKVDKFKGRKDCEIEPYTLGVFLGDGSYMDHQIKRKDYVGKSIRNVSGYTRQLKSGKILNVSPHSAGFFNPNDNKGYVRSRSLNITSADTQIMQEVSKFYEIKWICQKKGTCAQSYNFSVVGKLSNQLEKYNLNGKDSGTKFIPQDALLSNLEYRKRLLAGLIDTDGYLSRGQGYSITTKSQELSEGIRFLVYSLGGRASIRKVKKGIRKIGFVGEYYCISFYLGDISLPLQLHKKIKNSSYFYLSASRTSIKLKEAPRKKVYGFTLDSYSHWYVTDNFMITKNCGKSVWAMQQAGAIDPTLFEDALDKKKLDRICFTGEDTLHAIRNTKSTKSHTKVIIFDEAFRGLSSRSTLSKINGQIIQVLMEMRQNNLVLFIVLPLFSMLDRYALLNRGNALFHIHKPVQRNNKKIYYRSFYIYNYNLKGGLAMLDKKKSWNYPIRSRVHGKFYDKYPGGLEFEKLYRHKKQMAFREVGRKLSGETEESRAQMERNLALWELNKKCGYSQAKIGGVIRYNSNVMPKSTVSDAIKKADKYLTSRKTPLSDGRK